MDKRSYDQEFKTTIVELVTEGSSVKSLSHRNMELARPQLKAGKG